MAALTWTTTLEDQCAYAVFNSTYALLTAAQKARMDGGAVANPPTAGAALEGYRFVQRLAQWFETAGTITLNTAATEAAEALLVAEVNYRMACTFRPDRAQVFGSLRKQLLEDYLGTVARSEISTGYTAGDYTLTPQSIRLYVLGHTVRRKERLIVPPEDIDAATYGVLIWLWNKSAWTFRRRRVTVRVTPYAVSGGTWTNSTLTLSTIDVSTYTLLAGDLFYPAAQTNVVREPIEVLTRPGSTSVTLNSTFSATLGDLTDVAGTILQTRIFGLAASEVFDSLATRSLYSADDSFEVADWSDADEMSWLSGGSSSSTGQPLRVRIGRNANTPRWYWNPIPSGSYEFRSEALIAPPGTTTPGVPTSATDGTPYAKLPREFQALFKELVLGRILLNRGITGDVWKSATDELDRCAPIYMDNGNMDQGRPMRDVYNDAAYQLGGPM